MRRRSEPAVRGYRLNTQIIFFDHFGGAFQAHFKQILMRSYAASLFEQIDKMKTTDARFSGKLVKSEIFRAVMPHKLQHAGESPDTVMVGLLGTEADPHAVVVACRLGQAVQAHVHLVYLLASLLDVELGTLDAEKLQVIGRRACAAGAVIATRSGALESMPTAAELDDFLASAGSS